MNDISQLLLDLQTLVLVAAPVPQKTLALLLFPLLQSPPLAKLVPLPSFSREMTIIFHAEDSNFPGKMLGCADRFLALA